MVLIEDYDSGGFSSKGRIGPRYLYRAGQWWGVLRGGERQAVRCNPHPLQDAPVGVELKTTQGELDGRIAHRGIHDKENRLCVMCAATAYHRCRSGGIPSE